VASLESGDTLFLYTDGVTEMTDPKGHRFSEGRLVELLDGATVEVQILINNVLTSPRTFQASAEKADDITMLAFRFKGAR
jgi:sigma-B regulation protein RsbU (phosphoserine phosphatase)